MLDTSTQKTIGHLLAEMSFYSLNRPLLYNAILKELANICDVKGPCSLMRVALTAERGGYLFGKPAHINLNAVERHTVLPLWERYIRGGNNPLLRGILLRHNASNYAVDFASATELLNDTRYHQRNSLRNRLFDKLAKISNLEGMAYVWLQLNSQCIWAVCLRHRAGEGRFSDTQKSLLLQFCHAAKGNQGSWYIPAFDSMDTSGKSLKDRLTARQYETLFHLGRHCSRKECAKLMNVSPATIDRHIEALLETFRKHNEAFKGKAISHIIRELKDQAFICH